MDLRTKQQYSGRARAAELHYGPDDPRTIERRSDLAAVLIEADIERRLADAPPLRPEQIDRLSALLRGA